jgi:hypothetical protein
MGTAKVVLLGAALVAACGTGVAVASGGPPPPPVPDPPAYTVVASGTGRAAVVRPARRTDATIDRAVRAARARAMPGAIAVARREAAALGDAARLVPGAVVGVRRDTPPAGWWSEEEGRFGPGRWCGRIFAGRRTVRGADGTTRRVARYRHGCQVPKTVSLRLSVTFAATPR